MISKDRRLASILHIMFWAVFFMQYIFLVPKGESLLDINAMLHRLLRPISMFIIFYINYLWLAPNYYLNKKYRRFFIINTTIIILVSLAMQHIMEHPAPNVTHPSPPLQIHLVFIVRHAMEQIVFAALATMIRLSLKWQSIHEVAQEMEKEKTEAQLLSLRSQIRPHFLLNTLNNIYALIAFDQPKAQRAVMSLSSMLRQMIYGNTENAISIKKEVEFIENYVKLMKIRLPDNVKVDMVAEIPKRGDNIMIAPLIIISLVENAFKHGVSPTEPSFISININATAERIVCDICNSNFPKNDKDRSGHGIGLQLVESRLQLYYKGKHTWEKKIENNIYKSKIIIYDTELRNNR
jgi:sensor histidine kinase YesM